MVINPPPPAIYESRIIHNSIDMHLRTMTRKRFDPRLADRNNSLVRVSSIRGPWSRQYRIGARYPGDHRGIIFFVGRSYIGKLWCRRISFSTSSTHCIVRLSTDIGLSLTDQWKILLQSLRYIIITADSHDNKFHVSG